MTDRKLPGPEEVGALLGMPPCRYGGHPNASMWLQHYFVCCPCGISWNRKIYSTITDAVLKTKPKAHCLDWRPGDPEDRFHARKCEFKGLRLVHSSDRMETA